MKSMVLIMATEHHPVSGILAFDSPVEKKIMIFGLSEKRGNSKIYCSVRNEKVNSTIAEAGYSFYDGTCDFIFDPEQLLQKEGVIAIGISKDIRHTLSKAKYMTLILNLVEAISADTSLN